MQTKFNIGDTVFIYDITEGIVEGVITAIYTKARTQYRDMGDLIIMHYTTRYTIETRRNVYNDEPEHTIYRSRKELTEAMIKMLKEDETE